MKSGTPITDYYQFKACARAEKHPSNMQDELITSVATRKKDPKAAAKQKAAAK